MNSLTFCRRFSLKVLSSISTPTKCFQYNGGLRFSRYYTKKLQWPPIYAANRNQYYAPPPQSDCWIVKRHKQTSSEQKATEDGPPNVEEPPEKLSLFKRYHKMLKEYWYVLLPVHGVTSVFWFGGFYYAAKCGMDIVPFLEFINVPEKFIEPLRNSKLGYIALATAFYKLATPARYMVTLGGTTVAVKFLTKRGLIKPAPTKAQIKTIIQNKLGKGTDNKP